ncbi:hypothetical protein HY572_03065 [Candidatus Micrarchaeota archaeon]|nr:hypothetical protein [Candidatus Micrarchaeota archaeon]
MHVYIALREDAGSGNLHLEVRNRILKGGKPVRLEQQLAAEPIKTFSGWTEKVLHEFWDWMEVQSALRHIPKVEVVCHPFIDKGNRKELVKRIASAAIRNTPGPSRH